MKSKLRLICLIAAGLIACLGVTACSGDLHNLDGYYLVGSMTNWDPNAALLIKDGQVNFTASSSSDEFQFLPTLGSWNGQINRAGMCSGSAPSGITIDTEGTNGNGKISGLTSGKEYKMKIASVDGLIEVSIDQ